MPVSRPFGSSPLGGTGASPQIGPLLTMSIGPIDVTPMLLFPSLRITKELNARDELQASFISTTGYVPALGEAVIVYYVSGLTFVGTVHERDITFLSKADSVHIQSSIRCVDLNEICDRRIVFDVFVYQSAGDIVRFIRQQYLAVELIQDGDIQDGAFITRYVAAAMTVSEVMNELCEQSGFNWSIDYQRGLNFFARTTSPAPFTITSSNAVFHTITGSRTRNQYRNVEYIAGGTGLTDSRMEPFVGDGTRRTFTVEYPIFEAPTITRNFIAQSVGIRGIDTSTQFTWNKGENEIGHSGNEPVLQPNERIQVTYRGSFQLFGVVQDTAAVLERKSVEVGSGIYERVDQSSNIDGQQLVQEKALSLLRRYSSLDDTIEFDTDVPGLEVGHLLSVDVPELSLTGDYLITKLDSEFLLPERRRFRVSATTGEIKGRYQEFFARLLGASQPITIRDGEILQEVKAMHDPVSATDTIFSDLISVVSDDVGVAEFGEAEWGP